MSVLGIDLSSHALHLAVLEEDSNEATVHAVRLDLERGDAERRIRRMRDLMPARGVYRDLGVTLIAIERPIAAHSSVPLMVYGALLQLLPPDIAIVGMRADDWRRECCLPLRGARSDLKAASKRFARQLWTNSPDVFDDDTAEAYLIAWAAREIDLRGEGAAAAA